jgi:hypothetical protein
VRRLPTLPWLAVAALLAAGCAGPPGATPQQEAERAGRLAGLVADDLLVPLPGANVHLPVLDRSAEADTAGRFTLESLPPGRHQIVAYADGHRSGEQWVHVTPDAESYVELYLTPQPPAVPHRTTLAQDGIFGCGVSWRPTTGYNGVAACGFLEYAKPVADFSPYDRFLLTWTLPGGPVDWTASVFEMEWRSTQLLGRGLTMRWEMEGCINTGDGDLGGARGPSPLRAVASPDQIVRAVRDACAMPSCTPDRCPVVSRVFAEPETLGAWYPADVGVSVQQTYRQYHTAFYRGDAPADFTVLG